MVKINSAIVSKARENSVEAIDAVLSTDFNLSNSRFALLYCSALASNNSIWIVFVSIGYVSSNKGPGANTQTTFIFLL
jgi:hypothetical protein